MSWIFENRFEAGRRLAEELIGYRQTESLVLAIPRGGLQVGFPIAYRLECPLEVALSKKIGYPGNPEFAIGAVSLAARVVNPEFDFLRDHIEAETRRLRQLLQERERLYHRDWSPETIENRTAIVVDDGIATGHTVKVTVELVRESGAAAVVVAVPVAPPEALPPLKRIADRVVCLHAPSRFHAIGEFYQSFDQVSDEEAVRLLQQSRSIPSPGTGLDALT